MSNITASMVKELREKTSAGMMDCKKALNETNGDMEAACDWLRKKGLSSAAKKAGRVAAEGLVGVFVDGTTGAATEINSETDFVSKNDGFKSFVGDVSKLAVSVNGDVEALKSADLNGKAVSENLTDLIAKIGENMNIRRTSSLSVNDGVVASYVHNTVSPNLGKIAVLVGLESTGDKSKLNEVAKQVAMHVAAANPTYLSVSDVDESALNHEREILSDQARASGKPENIIEKMVEGRIRKYYEEVCLTEQAFVMDTDKKVKDIVADAAKDLGTDIKLANYVRMELGQGIEKKEDNFAEEVAQMSK